MVCQSLQPREPSWENWLHSGGVGVAVSPDTPDETATVLAALQADADYYQTFVQHCASRRPMLNLDKYNALLLDHLNSLFCEKNDG